VRTLSTRTDQFSEEIRQKMSGVNEEIQAINSSIEKFTELDLNAPVKAQASLREMWSNISLMTENASSSSSEVKNLAVQIQDHVMAGIISLQFEDIATQQLKLLSDKTEGISRLSQELFHVLENNDHQHAGEALKQLLTKLKAETQILKISSNQENMESGEVSFFS